MGRLSNRVFYLIETLLLRSPFFQLMLVGVVLFLLSLMAGVAVHVVNPESYAHTGEAVWWAFLRLSDPGYLGQDQGLFPRFVSTLLTLAGYVIFVGVLVALMTNWLNRSVAYLASGRSPIFEEGHVLLIGWNARLHVLIEEIVHSDAQNRSEHAESVVVVLCDSFEPDMYRRLVGRLDPEVRDQCRVLVRSGDPLDIDSLERVDFRHARSIIVLSEEADSIQARTLADTKSAKVLMSMKAQAPELERLPTVVVEVANPKNKLLLESVGWTQSTEAIASDNIMGRIICQSVRHPGIAKVYHRLLTDTYGDSIVLSPASSLGLVGKRLKDNLSSIASSIPIGLLRSPGRQENLELLALEREVLESDLVVLVVSRLQEEMQPNNSSQDDSTPVSSPKERRVLVVGWSTDLATFVEELAANPQERSTVTLWWEKEHPQDEKRLRRLVEDHTNLDLEVCTGIYFEDQMEHPYQDYHVVVLLAEEGHERLLADAENVTRCVQLHRLFLQQDSRPHLVVELNEEDNRALLEDIPCDILMTGEILSHLLAQVSTQRSRLWIYEELFTKGGAELRLAAVVESGETLKQRQSKLLAKSSVLLGVHRRGQVILAPEMSERLQKGDRLITVELETKNPLQHI